MVFFLGFTQSKYLYRFYTECLGMKLLRRRDIPEEKYTNAFLGYGPEDTNFVVELTYSKYITFYIVHSIQEFRIRHGV